MDINADLIFIALLIIGLVYLFFLHPKLEKKREMQSFDDRVIGCIDGLYIAADEAGVRFRCTVRELRQYILLQLSEAHKLPGNQVLIKYMTKNGRVYQSHTLRDDHVLFALLCIAEYARKSENDELVSFCESMMLDASRLRYHAS